MLVAACGGKAPDGFQPRPATSLNASDLSITLVEARVPQSAYRYSYEGQAHHFSLTRQFTDDFLAEFSRYYFRGNGGFAEKHLEYERARSLYQVWVVTVRNPGLDAVEIPRIEARATTQVTRFPWQSLDLTPRLSIGWSGDDPTLTMEGNGPAVDVRCAVTDQHGLPIYRDDPPDEESIGRVVTDRTTLSSIRPPGGTGRASVSGSRIDSPIYVESSDDTVAASDRLELAGRAYARVHDVERLCALTHCSWKQEMVVTCTYESIAGGRRLEQQWRGVPELRDVYYQERDGLLDRAGGLSGLRLSRHNVPLSPYAAVTVPLAWLDCSDLTCCGPVPSTPQHVATHEIDLDLVGSPANATVAGESAVDITLAPDGVLYVLLRVVGVPNGSLEVEMRVGQGASVRWVAEALAPERLRYDGGDMTEEIRRLRASQATGVEKNSRISR